MSTLEEFENAPVGATATHPDGRKAVGTFDYVEGRWYATDYNWYTDGEMARQGYILDPVSADLTQADQQLQNSTLWTVTDLVDALTHGRVHIAPGPIPALTAPTSAQGALDLAWDLGHPVKEGQVIPKGAKWMKKVSGNVQEYTMRQDYTITITDTYILRTHEPLSDPEWLDAPAVLAAMDDCSWQKVWLPRSEGRWVCTCCGVERHWSKMNDVTPLYPKGTEND